MEEALARPIVPTSAYGEPAGKSTTLAEIIVNQARAYLNEKTDGRGNTELYSNRATSKPRITWLIREQVDAAVKNELAAELAAAKESLRETLRQAAAAKLAEAVKA
jgi:hypothetical protein